jgi:hypothetical protein
MKKITLTFYSDPGHAWLKVPRVYLNTLGIAGRITVCSYQRKGCVYLDEDYDAEIFLRAAKAANWKISIREHVAKDRLSRIRNYAAYNATYVPA